MCTLAAAAAAAHTHTRKSNSIRLRCYTCHIEHSSLNASRAPLIPSPTFPMGPQQQQHTKTRLLCSRTGGQMALIAHHHRVRKTLHMPILSEPKCDKRKMCQLYRVYTLAHNRAIIAVSPSFVIWIFTDKNVANYNFIK